MSCYYCSMKLGDVIVINIASYGCKLCNHFDRVKLEKVKEIYKGFDRGFHYFEVSFDCPFCGRPINILEVPCDEGVKCDILAENLRLPQTSETLF